MGSRESSSNKASSDGPVPLCVAYTKRCRAKERRNGLGSARRTSRKPDAPRNSVPSGSLAKSSMSDPDFPGPPHQTLQGQNPRHPYGCDNWRNLDSLGASPSALAGTILQLVHLQSNHRPQGERGRRGIKQTGQHPFLASPGWSVWGCWWPSKSKRVATNQVIRLES